MLINDRIFKTDNPVLFDRPIQEIQDSLGTIEWLDYILGRSQRITDYDVDGNYYKYPAVHVQDMDYEDVLPNKDKFGNYSFFIVDSTYKTPNWDNRINDNINASYGIIFWVDLATIADATERNTDYIKAYIMDVLKNTHLKTGRFTVEEIVEGIERVYGEYSAKEVDQQFLLHPYYAFRINGKLWVNHECIS